MALVGVEVRKLYLHFLASLCSPLVTHALSRYTFILSFVLLYFSTHLVYLVGSVQV